MHCLFCVLQHLKCTGPLEDDYEEMICYLCMVRLGFLRYYTELQMFGVEGQTVRLQKDEAPSGNVDIETDTPHPQRTAADAERKAEVDVEVDVKAETKVMSQVEETAAESKCPQEQLDANTDQLMPGTDVRPQAETSATTEVTVKTDPEASAQSSGCLLQNAKEKNLCENRDGTSTFWRTGWRRRLCTCSSCKVLINVIH